jgi:hypothetical protein
VDTAASHASFGPYQLVSVIAHSDRASVYRAIDTRHGDRVVALKIFAPALSADPAFRARFRQDAAALTAVRDPHLVPVHTFGEHAGAVFLDMRFVDAPTLAEIRTTRALPPERSAAVATQIDQGLAAVAASALGQRSVEPAEVLVTGRNGAEFVQLVGLGLGRAPTDPAPPPLPTPPRRRRWVLVASLAAAIALAVTAAVAIPWRGGRTAPPPGALAVLDDSDDVVAAIAVQAGDRSFLSGVSFTGELRTWDLATGATAGPVIEDSGYAPAGAVQDGTPMVLTRDSAQVLHSYRLPDGREATPPTGPAAPVLSGTQRGEIRAVVPAELDGRPVAVLLDPADPAATEAFERTRIGYQVRRLDDGSTVGPLVGFPNLSLNLAPAVAVIDGRPAVVSAFDPPTVSLGEQRQRLVRVLDMVTGTEVVPALSVPVETVALSTTTRAGTPVALLAGADNTVRIVDLRTGVVSAVLTGTRTPVERFAVVPSGGRTLIMGVTGPTGRAEGAEIRCWDLQSGDPVGPVLRGPAADGYLTAGTVGDRAVIAATEGNGTDGGRVVVRELDTLLGGS